jgi:hypothetical protein
MRSATASAGAAGGSGVVIIKEAASNYVQEHQAVGI